MSNLEKKLKVLMVTMSLKIGGAETHILELAKDLNKKGVEVFVASAGGEYVKELADVGIRHFNAPLNNKRIGNLITSYKTLKRIIVENNIEIVHAHARIPAFICGFVCKRLKVKFVTTAHWVFNTSLPYRLLSNWGQAALAVSDDIKDYLIKNYNYDPNKIIVTVNGIDTDKFNPNIDGSGIIKEFSLDPSKKRIVSISRLDESRSLAAHKLIEAAPELEKRFSDQLEIVIVGDGDDFDNIKKKAAAVNELLNKRIVILTGKRTDTNRFLSATDIFVNVSRSALEAMAAERPLILAGNEGYIGIFNKDKYNDAVNSNFCCRGGFPDTTKELLIKDITTLLKMDKEELRTLGRYGKEVIVSNYSADKMSKDALSLYELVSHQKKKYDVVLSGYYGSKNHGDDAILTAITDDLRRIIPNINILVLSRKPEETQRLFNVNSINTFNIPKLFFILGNTSLLISGGGTLVQDLTSTKSLLYYLFVMKLAMKRGAKVMLYASGVGPLRLEANRIRASKVLKKVDLITLRDELSLKTLKKLDVTNVKTVVTADVVFGLKYRKEGETVRRILKETGIDDKKYFCVAVRSWKYLKNDFEDIISEFVKYVWEKYKIVALFIPMQPSKDLDISRRIFNKSGGSLLEKDFTINEILGIVGNAQFVLSMRLHTIIYAAKMGSPVLSLSYDPKVTGIMEIFSQKYNIDIEDVTLEKLKNFVGEIITRHDEISEELKQTSQILEEKVFSTALMAAEIINRRNI